MAIELQWDLPGQPLPGLEALLDDVCATCFRLEGLDNAGMAIRIVSSEEIRRLNQCMRGIDRVTDVLSFPTIALHPGQTAGKAKSRVRRQYDPFLGYCNLGDCAICLERAREQAAEYGHALRREIAYLAAHAAFHLMGYDHMQPEDQREMRSMEKKAMAALAIYKAEEPMSDQQLYEMACSALKMSYAPYSQFAVGACLLSTDGRTFTGCNIENASYGATICAERCAVSRAVAEGARRFSAIAVVGESALAWPCGICRQVLNEFSEDMRVICGQAGKGFEVVKLSELLPRSFGPNELAGGNAHGE